MKFPCKSRCKAASLLFCLLLVSCRPVSGNESNGNPTKDSTPSMLPVLLTVSDLPQKWNVEELWIEQMEVQPSEQNHYAILTAGRTLRGYYTEDNRITIGSYAGLYRDGTDWFTAGDYVFSLPTDDPMDEISPNIVRLGQAVAAKCVLGLVTFCQIDVAEGCIVYGIKTGFYELSSEQEIEDLLNPLIIKMSERVQLLDPDLVTGCSGQ